MPKKVSPKDLLFEEASQARYGDNRRKQPLIIPKILARAAEYFNPLDDEQTEHHKTVIKWADLESTGRLQKKSELTLQGEFIAEIFGGVLGYTRYSQSPDSYELHEHFSISGGKDAHAAIGLFGKDNGSSPVAVIELKGPTVNVDRQRIKGRTPVGQCWDYLDDLPDCPWGIVCNYVSFRLYHRNQTTQSYEIFTLQELRDVKRFREFLTLFERGGLLPSTFSQVPRAIRLLNESQQRQREVGKELYKLYHEKRLEFVGHLCKSPFDKTLDQAIAIAQTLLDRIVFIAFCQCRELLPANSIDKAWSEFGITMVTNPRWHNFLSLFQSIDRGNERFGIPRFNGGLFAPNPEVDNLDLDDRWTDFFKTIGTYDFKDEVNVDVLGHLFEQSITDIETIKADPAVLAEPVQKVSGKRKREGVYYTPPRITTYIVEHTVKPCIDERFAAIAEMYKIDPSAEPEKGRMSDWVKCHEEMLGSLATLRICDPACGSGAFLVQAFDYLEGVYADLIAAICHDDEQAEPKMLEEAKKRILTDNLFGVDLSLEAVEIARLALWIRSARRGQTLADLSQNIQCGNSIVDDPAVDPKAMNWQSKFKAVFAEGGFDCVISNPPYVKLQNFRKTSPATAAYLVGRYRSAKTGNFDLFLPFIEHGLELLKPAGRLGFIAPSLWTFNEYGQGLRELVLEKRALERFVDFKSFQVFEDATTYTALQFFANKAVESIQVVDAGDGDPEANAAFTVSFANLGSGAWAFLPDTAQHLLDAMRLRSIPLAEATSQVFQGLVTSADAVYHLIKIGEGRYYSHSLKDAVQLEDDLAAR